MLKPISKARKYEFRYLRTESSEFQNPGGVWYIEDRYAQICKKAGS